MKKFMMSVGIAFLLVTLTLIGFALQGNSVATASEAPVARVQSAALTTVSTQSATARDGQLWEQTLMAVGGIFGLALMFAVALMLGLGALNSGKRRNGRMPRFDSTPKAQPKAEKSSFSGANRYY